MLSLLYHIAPNSRRHFSHIHQQNCFPTSRQLPFGCGHGIVELYHISRGLSQAQHFIGASPSFSLYATSAGLLSLCCRSGSAANIRSASMSTRSRFTTECLPAVTVLYIAHTNSAVLLFPVALSKALCRPAHAADTLPGNPHSCQHDTLHT